MSRTRVGGLGVALVLAFVQAGGSQPLFTDAVTPQEFAARRAELAKRIGDGVAVLTGATEYAAYVSFRQNNQFFYLTGVEVPRAILVVDGKTKASTLYLPPRDERVERSEGPVLVPGEDARHVTGIESVLPRDQFAEALVGFAREGRTVHVPFRPETLSAGTPHHGVDHAAASSADPWDARPSKEAAFIERIREHAPRLAIQNLDPFLDEMRMIKSPREIELIREATRISGLGLMEGMRAAQPGMYEYEITAVADYLFRKHNAYGPAYFSLIATGKNAFYPHYHGGQGQLRDGDLVLFDYAPDYKYYSADVTRMFPANGKFTPSQRELYTTYLRLYQALMTSIRPNVTPQVVIDDAVKKMDAYLASTTIADPKVGEAARRFVDAYRTSSGNSLGHFVGMEVHDVGVPFEKLEPGMIFTIEPALTIPEDRVYVRLEDMILVTKNGYENLSAFVPVEIEQIEKLMAEPGLGERPPKHQTSEAGALR
jgi:Xaa-Pro aminopeptidase